MLRVTNSGQVTRNSRGWLSSAREITVAAIMECIDLPLPPSSARRVIDAPAWPGSLPGGHALAWLLAAHGRGSVTRSLPSGVGSTITSAAGYDQRAISSS